MTTSTHTPAPWSAEDVTTAFYNTSGDRVEMLEIRANVTENGWDTVAFVEAIWPGARDNARLIAAAPAMLEALQVQQMAEYDPEASRRKGYFDRARELRQSAISAATQQQEG